MDTRFTCAVAGAKGGVGKTTTSINLGASLAAAGYATVTVELDLAMANLVDFLDVDIDVSEATTLHDVLAGESDVEAATYETDTGLDVVPSGTDLEGYAETDLRRLPDVVERLRWHYDIVLLDTPAGLSEETVRPLQVADETILVSTPRVASVRNVQNTKQLAERVGCDVRGLLLTKSGTGASPGAERVAEFLEVELLGHVPEDEAVPHSQDRGRPVVSNAPNSGAAIAYRKVARRLVESERTGADRRPQHAAPEGAGAEQGAHDRPRTNPDGGRTHHRDPLEGGQVTRERPPTDAERAAETGETRRAESDADHDSEPAQQTGAATPDEEGVAGETDDRAVTEEGEPDAPDEGDVAGATAEQNAAGETEELDAPTQTDEPDATDVETQADETDESDASEETGESADESRDTAESPAAEFEPGDTTADGAASLDPAEETSTATSVRADANESPSDPDETTEPAVDEGRADETEDDASAEEEDGAETLTSSADPSESGPSREQPATTGSDDGDEQETRTVREGEQASGTPGEDESADGTASVDEEKTEATGTDGSESSSESEDRSVASRVLSLFSF